MSATKLAVHFRPATSDARNTTRGSWGRFVTRPEPWWLIIVVGFLAAWQWVPSIPGIRNTFVFADPFFISSPRRTGIELWREFTGVSHTTLIWGPFSRTLVTALIGTLCAVVVGALGGLLCSNWLLLNRIARPFLVLFNALPKVAIIPVIVLIAGSSATSDAVTAFIVVIFVVFFNAYEGGVTVPAAMLQNARILGAGSPALMFKVRFPFVLAWTFAALPNAIAFGLVGTVTAELFTGSSGIGQVLIAAVDTSNSDLTFAVVLILGFAGVVLVLGADLIRRKVLHWW